MPDYKFNRIFIIFFFVVFALDTTAQKQFINDTVMARRYIEERGEVYFSFEASISEVRRLSNVIWIDKYAEGSVYAYAGKEGFSAFLEESIAFTVYSPPGEWYKERPGLKNGNWDYYPAYSAYVEMMQSWSVDYSHLCEYVDAGTTSGGRKILFLKISGSNSTFIPKPRFMYSSTMHGDETVGFIMMLRLIEYLLENYPHNPQVKHLMDNLEIWINPLANPDGCYFGGDPDKIDSPKRTNFNNTDLNRDFPVIHDSNYHIDGREPETVAMMEVIEKYNFTMSANIHGGAEVINYPWDSKAERHADDRWFEYISREYADTAQHYSPPAYMTYLGGVTNGHDWYSITGGRQDYVTFFTGGREITMEISDVKHPPVNTLADYWEYNRRSLLNYMEQAIFGVRGRIRDAVTGEAVRAKVKILSYDTDSSHIYSDSLSGWYFRLLEQGIYNLLFSATGYYNDTVSVQVWNRDTSRIDVSMVPLTAGSPSTGEPDEEIFHVFYSAAEEVLDVKIYLPESVYATIVMYDISGREIRLLHEGWTEPRYSSFTFTTTDINNGLYIIALNFRRSYVSRKIFISE